MTSVRGLTAEQRFMLAATEINYTPFRHRLDIVKSVESHKQGGNSINTIDVLYNVPQFTVFREGYQAGNDHRTPMDAKFIVAGESSSGREVVVKHRKIEKAILNYITEVLLYAQE